ncbi:antibiotic biosynthesis monooxygenase family protein [Desulfolutivibrio sulfoxidireducens]|uniref:antibiotic biosynthesis monooxygenase family protein n=1 Tax=Desulfolutivibrio sulfoxidireducens TaxID=2773299 RepID=UPI00159DD10F|nr:antibiotic biosynthesis monooxygenase [Desulfolutivibrio sulfoxidireducens]QLA17810.1 antibiotic biosynthesis monooxygenase [Desulfolutivibrio sulfoxidireducens]QLA21388.1 antibiotic biosynthesis monooxygenase [Desulfolutivibrio sulfoxidireducens]
MIARLWTCRTPLSKADAFEAHLLATGVAEVKKTPGNLGATILRREAGGVAHFVMISYWEDFTAIQAFAGQDLDRAWLHGDDALFDLDPDMFVTHHQVIRRD